MSGFNTIMYKGRRISPEEYCRETKTKMIKVKKVKRYPNMFTGKIVVTETIEEIPERLFDTMRMTHDGPMYFRLDNQRGKNDQN